MIIHHISDTHGFHGSVKLPDKMDVLIHSGDAANWYDRYRNEQEMRNFITWFSDIPKAEYKIYVAGNHDTSIEAGLITKENFEQAGIIYLENESIELENGLKIWGSPMTPSFNNWAFNVKRSKLHDLWATIPDDTDIVITHGPPQSVLDLTETFEREFKQCGCKALKKRIFDIEPKYHMFGHIHNQTKPYIYNSGIFKLANCETIFSNGACVTDRKFDLGNTSNGNTFYI